MSDIEWTDATWNPVVGCSPVSPGCLNCYAATMARRLEAMGRPEYQTRLLDERGNEHRGAVPDEIKAKCRNVRIAEVRGGRAVFTGDVRTVESRLTDPLHWRKPRRVFVNSMSDLFHEAVPFEFIDRVFAVMALCPQHTFQILTKRPERMAEYTRDYKVAARLWDVLIDHNEDWGRALGRTADTRNIDHQSVVWPLPNVWLGTSVENQPRAKRVWDLFKCPAAIRFVSVEPMVGPVDLDAVEALYKFWRRGASIGVYLDWVIVGGESGPKSRPCDVKWIRSIVRQCKEAGVPCFVKQLGKRPSGWCDQCGKHLISNACGPTHAVMLAELARVRDAKGGDPSEWPEDLRVRETP